MHAVSVLAAQYRQVCAGTETPTYAPTIAPSHAPTAQPSAPPTFAPTTHACDAGTHYCWADAAGESSATCTATAGADYTCECPAGHEETFTHFSHQISDLEESLRHQCASSHHCSLGTHYCWANDDAEASCTPLTSGDTTDYTCACPTGFPQTQAHMMHAVSHVAAIYRHACLATDSPTSLPTIAPTHAPTVTPTATPTAHHCNAGTHYCWADSEGIDAATCTASTGDDYTCECPDGYDQTFAHFSHAVSVLAEVYRHVCQATPAPTPPPSPAPTAAPTLPPTEPPTVAHACNDGTNYCWSDDVASATCTATMGAGVQDYTCECPAGYTESRIHFNHYVSSLSATLAQECSAPWVASAGCYFTDYGAGECGQNGAQNCDCCSDEAVSNADCHIEAGTSQATCVASPNSYVWCSGS